MQLAFYHGPRTGWWKLVSWVVKLWSRGRFCHVDLVFSGGLTGTASLSLGGVKLLRKEYNPDHWVFVDVGHRYDEDKALSWFIKNYGAGFDVMGMFGFVWPWLGDDPKRYFCSEAVAYALGYPEGFRFSPSTLYAMATREG